MVEVAIGADLCTVDEAHDFLEEVPEKLDFMATSCCPAWSMMAKTAFPGLAKNISMTMTPMVFTARMMKQADPDARMCFIGPCAAKKLEASRRTVRSDVDFVLTFEELQALFRKRAADAELSILEGVMGYYDGLGGVSDRDSTWDVACATNTPVILVVRPKGASLTIAAQVQGMLSFRKNHFCLNRDAYL